MVGHGSDGRRKKRTWSAINDLSGGRVMAAVSDAQRMQGCEQTRLGKQIGVSEGEHCSHPARTRRHESRRAARCTCTWLGCGADTGRDMDGVRQ
jgi:hypothetical protein